MKQVSRSWFLVAAWMVTLLVTGCDTEDRRVAELAQQNAVRQAAQTEEMAKLNREVAEAHKNVTDVQRQLQVDQGEVGRQRDKLEDERRRIAQSRHSDGIIAAILGDFGIVLAAAVTVGLCALIVVSVWRTSADGALVEVLAVDLTSDNPVLLEHRDSAVSPVAVSAPAGDPQHPTP